MSCLHVKEIFSLLANPSDKDESLRPVLDKIHNIQFPRLAE